jgi:hypothetical protein
MRETLIFGPISVKFRSINPCKLLNISNSLIALPIQMIRPANPDDSYFGGGCHTPPYPLKFRPWMKYILHAK